MNAVPFVPGPLEPPERRRPSLNMTALSYSWTTCKEGRTELHLSDKTPKRETLPTDLEADEEGEGQRDGHDAPRDHGEEPAADPDAAVRLVG